jgi:hypothetical protein
MGGLDKGDVCFPWGCNGRLVIPIGDNAFFRIGARGIGWIVGCVFLVEALASGGISLIGGLAVGDISLFGGLTSGGVMA